MIKNKKKLIIALTHDTAIKWDDSALTHDTAIKWDDCIITHCTSVTDVEGKNNVYEIMVIKNKNDGELLKTVEKELKEEEERKKTNHRNNCSNEPEPQKIFPFISFPLTIVFLLLFWLLEHCNY